MTRLVVTELISLDGVVEAPGGGDHPHAGWTFKAVPFEEAAYEIKGREQEEAGALLLGRRTYEEFAPVWPSMDEFAEYNAMPKHVVSTTLQPEALSTDWGPTSLHRSLDEVAALKESGEVEGDLIVHGSPTLARSLLAAGLVDRYHLLVFPVVLGAGLRLFDDTTHDAHRLALVEHAAYGNGVTLQVLEPRRD
jgi:dihydrofolate reductase